MVKTSDLNSTEALPSWWWSCQKWVFCGWWCWADNSDYKYPPLVDWIIESQLLTSCLRWFHNVCVYMLFIFVFPTAKQKQEVCMQRNWRKGRGSKTDLCFKLANVLHALLILLKESLFGLFRELQCILWFCISMRVYSLVEQRLFLEMGIILSVILERKCHCSFFFVVNVVVRENSLLEIL